MAAPIVVNFQVGGIRDVMRGFETVEKRADVHARNLGRVEERTQRERVRANDRAERTKLQIQNRSFAYEQRLRERAARDAERAEAAKTRSAEREAQRRLQIQNRSFAAEQRLRERALADERRAAERSNRAMGRFMSRTVGGGVGNALGIAGRVAGSLAALGGGFAIADSVGRGLALERTAGQIARGAASNPKNRSGQDLTDIARTAALSGGGTAEDALGALDAFVKKTGNIEMGIQALQRLTKIAAATGTSFEDMSSAAAGVANQIDDFDELERVIRSLAGGGKAGAIEFRDLATEVDALASQVNSFAANKSQNLMALGAVAQTARATGGATSASEATTSVVRFLSDTRDKADKIKAVGFDVFGNDKGQLKDVPALVEGVLTATKGNVAKIGDIYGERGIRALSGFAGVYNDAGGGKAGIQAVRDQFAKFQTPISQEDIDRGHAARMAETNAKLTKASEEFHAALQAKLLPVLPPLIEQFTKATPQLVAFVDSFGRLLAWVARNPWLGLGGLVAASISRELASAAIGQAASAALQAVIARIQGNATVGTPVGSAAGSVGKLQVATATIGALAVGAGVGSAIATGFIDPLLDGADAGKRKAEIMAGNVDTYTSALESGRISPEQAAKVLAEIQGEVKQAKVNAGSTGSMVSGAAQAMFGVGNLKTLKEQNVIARSKEIEEATDRLAKAINSAADRVANSDGIANPNDPRRWGMQ